MSLFEYLSANVGNSVLGWRILSGKDSEFKHCISGSEMAGREILHGGTAICSGICSTKKRYQELLPRNQGQLRHLHRPRRISYDQDYQHISSESTSICCEGIMHPLAAKIVTSLPPLPVPPEVQNGGR